MKSFQLSAGEVSAKAARGQFPLLATFAAAILVSAALLFLVQPMFTKMVLPRFGGAPSVWSVAMVFFQAALLAGYAFAHLLTRYVPGPRSVVIHLAVMLAATSALPLSIAAGWDRPPPAGETFWLIGLFTISIGLPFFALAGISPLLQAWFARTDHPAAKDPYFLYAASNVGSFLALLSYPVAIEPFLRLGDQAKLWSIGFGVLIVLIGACGVLLWRSPDQAPAAVIEGAADASPPAWRDAARWVVLAAVPAGLLISVTSHISTDVAAVPLLWVLPLALYLLTFVIVFARRPLIPHWCVVAVQPLFVLTGLVTLTFVTINLAVLLVAVHVAVFFVCALMCHGELARTRPAPKYLTAFYMWMSAGGVIGGIAAGLIAPHVFNWVAEYPILLALAVLCRPGLAWPRAVSAPLQAALSWLGATRFLQRSGALRRYALFGVLAAAALLLIVRTFVPIPIAAATLKWTIGALLVASALLWRGPFAAIVAFAVLLNFTVVAQARPILVRSFFGVSKIEESSDRQFRLLYHGTTVHGAQRIRDVAGQPVTGRPELVLPYYRRGSAIAQAFDAVRARARIYGPIRYAVIGLGAGSLACLAEPADTVHYYEIDPAIVRIARDPKLFSFLAVCRPDVPITLGDARLTLTQAPDGIYDLIIVDAFSSDAIPVHLLTREAMAIYLKKLGARGLVVLHVSNRHLELASVVAGIAAANGSLTRVYENVDNVVAAVARKEEDFGWLRVSPDWRLKAPDPRYRVWTDDYSNIVGSVLRKLRGR